jgi:hypothetical protein
MAKIKFFVTGDQYLEVDRKMCEIKDQLACKSGSPIDPRLVQQALAETNIRLQEIVEGEFRVSSENNILRLISGGQRIALGALDGSKFIYQAKDVFKSLIDPMFSDPSNRGMNAHSKLTPATSVNVYKTIRHGVYEEIFGSLPGTWEEKSMSQHQILEFCRIFSEWLKKDMYSTIFLCKINEHKSVHENYLDGNLMVVRVRVFSEGLRVSKRCLAVDDIWYGEDNTSHVVIPQLPIFA